MAILNSQLLIDELYSRQKEIVQGGDDSARKKHQQRGKLLVRERITLLLDVNSPWLELSLFAADQVYDESVPCAGLITGIGQVQGRSCMVIANDATVKGGIYFPLTVKKHLRAQAIALKNRLPCIYLVDSGGANLAFQDQVFPDAEHFGRIFFNQAKMSSLGIPQIAVVMGMCTAGGAYIPAMADETIIVKEQGRIFLAGPPLVKMATGEIVDSEELGGAYMHAAVSGVADYLAEDDKDALALTRSAIKHLPKQATCELNHDEKLNPQYKAEDIYALLSADVYQSFDVREIIMRLVDGSEFDEFKARFGKTIVCGFAKIKGLQIGIIANNGVLFSEAALKACHFIQLCCQRKTPLLFLQNITGFMVGKQAEKSGIAKHGAKMVAAVACAAVPKITVIIGASFGAGNYAMCGRAYDPSFLFSWPNAKIAVMGGVQAAGVLTHLKKSQLEAQGQTLTEDEIEQLQQPLLKGFNQQSQVYYGSARLWDDGIIDPAKTRDILAYCFYLCLQQPIAESHFSVFRM
ncbi:MAG: methylcrotonoyl-CoA carboxylase [Pseudomonadales bacterium]|nr:methylcrotonoyl-CoA carboxylase [Pseudomonadales bacterium]